MEIFLNGYDLPSSCAVSGVDRPRACKRGLRSRMSVCSSVSNL